MDSLKFTCSTRLFTILSKMWFPPHLEPQNREYSQSSEMQSSTQAYTPYLRAQSPEAISGQRIDLHVVETG